MPQMHDKVPWLLQVLYKAVGLRRGELLGCGGVVSVPSTPQ